jgi:hypothetical protein
LVQACLNCCTKALTWFIRLKKTFTNKIKKLELIVVNKIKLEKDTAKDRLDLVCVNKVEPYKRFNIAALAYTLTRLTKFKESLGAKELISSLTNFVKSVKRLNNKELSLFKYMQRMIASEEKIRAKARLSKDHNRVLNDSVN